MTVVYLVYKRLEMMRQERRELSREMNRLEMQRYEALNSIDEIDEAIDDIEDRVTRLAWQINMLGKDEGDR